MKRPKHIKQANFEQRKKNREKECDRCHEHPCRCDRGEPDSMRRMEE